MARSRRRARKAWKKQAAAPAREVAPRQRSARPSATRAPMFRSGQSLESKPAPVELSRQAVAEAAYYLWLQRGGSDVMNWLDAEADLRGRLQRTPRL